MTGEELQETLRSMLIEEFKVDGHIAASSGGAAAIAFGMQSLHTVSMFSQVSQKRAGKYQKLKT